MAIDQLTSSLVKNQFPDFYKEDSPGFLLFVKAYYEYMEQSGKSIHELNKLKSYKDIDDTLDEYIEYFRRTIIPSLPISVVSDKRLLAKTIRDFYQSKGTLDSYKFLFRILYDEDVEVSYPADQMLKVSDGDWQIDRYIVITSNEEAYKFIGKTIQGTESLAEAFVEDVVRRFLGGRDMMQLILSKNKGGFKNQEPIKIKSAKPGVGFEPVIEAGINTISVEGQGSEYAPGDSVDLISASTGREGKGVVTDVITQAGIINYTLVDGGSGYTASTGSPGTIIKQSGGDGIAPASFIISTSDITDTFAIARNINLFISNTVFGANAAVISYSPITDPTYMYDLTFANVVATNTNFSVGDIIQNRDAKVGSGTAANGIIQKVISSVPVIGSPLNSRVVVKLSHVHGTFTNQTPLQGVLYRGTTHIGNTVSWGIKPADVSTRASTFANTVISSPSYGFPELTEVVGNKSNFRTNKDAVIKIATNSGSHNLVVGQSLYGETSGANAVITQVTDATVGAGIFRVDTYKNFTGTENIKIATSATGSGIGNTIGTLVSGQFYANTIGYHILEVGKVNSQTITAGDELVGMLNDTFTIGLGHAPTNTPGTIPKPKAFGIVKKVMTSVPNGYLHQGTSNTSLSGTVTSSANTITGSGTTFTSDFDVGDEIKSGAQAGRRIFSIASDTSLVTSRQFDPVLSSATTYGKGGNYRTLLKLQVTANTTAALTSQWDAGPMMSFTELESVRKVGSSTVIGTVAYSTSNTQIENIHTKLIDALVFKNAAFGTIEDLSLKIGGAGYSVAPTITVNDSQISSLGIRDVFLHVQNTASNWATGNSQITTFDTNDRLEQALSGAKGDVKQIPPSSPQQFGKPLTTIVHANTTIETVIRVFQDELQATSNINYRLGRTAIKFHTSADQSALAGTGIADIVKIDDNGVLGQNAVITGTVGANGAIERIRTLDSGYAYKNGELVIFSPSTRPDASSGTGVLTMKNAANSEGYYASNRSQVSTKRGYIQDSERYQEFSYEISSGIAFNRYKDLVNNLVHPAGQKLFGQFTTRTPLDVNLSTVADNRTRKQSNGTFAITKTKASNTVSITDGSFTVTASNPLFRGVTTGATGNITRVANSQYMIVQTTIANVDKYYSIKVANATSATAANLVNRWDHGTIATANVYFANSFNVTGTSSSLSAEFEDNDVIVIETPHKNYNQIKLNKVSSATSANLTSVWTLADVSGANAYYYTGTVS